MTERRGGSFTVELHMLVRLIIMRVVLEIICHVQGGGSFTICRVCAGPRVCVGPLC